MKDDNINVVQQGDQAYILTKIIGLPSEPVKQKKKYD